MGLDASDSEKYKIKYSYLFTGESAKLTIATSGNVGIGTTNPLTLLHLSSPTSIAGVRMDATGGRAYSINSVAGTNPRFSLIDNSANSERMVIDSAGNVGIGTTNPGATLDVNGTTRTKVVEITGGSDLSEQFEVNAMQNRGQASVEPGIVVAIDPDNPGKLAVSRMAYDRKVAGIISGAGGIKPGMLMSQTGSMADGNHPVVLTGRVYCRADASNGPIEPGDLLTTSHIPGHAMKVTDYAQAQGAVLGKAMTGLKEGAGLVLVLVTLQ
jgi:hypothetical protein